METIINKTADKIVANNNAHLQLIRKFGGKKIKTATIACCASDKWDDEIASRDTFHNVVINKSSRRFYLYESGGSKTCLFDAPLSKIESYDCKVENGHVNLRISDGCLWEIGFDVA